MPGERFPAADSSLLRYLATSQELDARFPAFETEIHGIHLDSDRHTACPASQRTSRTLTNPTRPDSIGHSMPERDRRRARKERLRAFSRCATTISAPWPSVLPATLTTVRSALYPVNPQGITTLDWCDITELSTSGCAPSSLLVGAEFGLHVFVPDVRTTRANWSDPRAEAVASNSASPAEPCGPVALRSDRRWWARSHSVPGGERFEDEHLEPVHFTRPRARG